MVACINQVFLMFQIKKLNCLKQWENLLICITEKSRCNACLKIGLIRLSNVSKGSALCSALCSWRQFYPETDFARGCKMAANSSWDCILSVCLSLSKYIQVNMDRYINVYI